MKFSTDFNGRDMPATSVWVDIRSRDQQQIEYKLLVLREDFEMFPLHAIALDYFSRCGQLDLETQTFHLAVLRS